MATMKDALNYAADLLEKKDWCQKYYALDKEGETCSELDDQASCFCMKGAIYRSCYDLNVEYLPVHELFQQAMNSTDFMPAEWNDCKSTKKEDVIEILHKMAELT